MDSVVVRSPLPGGVAGVVRFLLNQPQWLQIGGLVVGVLLAIAIVVILWRRRRGIIAWFAALPRGALVGLGATAVVIVAGLVALGRVSWNYTQHNNDFCVSCHVMTTSYERFQQSEHKTLECHDCHQQSIFASARQVYYWVAERPADIPPHAKVPTRVCANCHIQERPDSVWKRISATAGHRVHLDSLGNSDLRGIQCVTCHGTELHRFLPVESTCGQSGCHTATEIRLGKMADQTQLHCVTCHQFTVPVSEHLSTDSASRMLVPTTRECLGCHAMRNILADFEVTRDPHHGECGACHDPHKQRTPAAAFESCTTSGCHARPDTLTPLHRGLPAGALAQCGSCHEAHTWTVKGTACLQCHQDIFAPSRNPPRRATRSAALPGNSRVLLAAFFTPRRADDSLPPFSHATHRSVSCTSCHSSRERHGQLVLQSARDCMACHHDPARTTADCTSCHERAALPARAAVATTVRTSTRLEPRTRTLPFSHAEHTTIACNDCHTAGVTLAPRACTDCHTEHHRATANCSSCHEQPARAAHPRSVHHGCGGSGCHADAAVLALAPTRSVCLVCHQNLVNHQPGRDCASCHATGWQAARASPGRK
jgi:nitrate/TMAO reductase-like tetraheme cytochrome c subunit